MAGEPTGVDQEVVEELDVFAADALVDPETVVVHGLDALAAVDAVVVQTLLEDETHATETEAAAGEEGVEGFVLVLDGSGFVGEGRVEGLEVGLVLLAGKSDSFGALLDEFDDGEEEEDLEQVEEGGLGVDGGDGHARQFEGRVEHGVDEAPRRRKEEGRQVFPDIELGRHLWEGLGVWGLGFGISRKLCSVQHLGHLFLVRVDLYISLRFLVLLRDILL